MSLTSENGGDIEDDGVVEDVVRCEVRDGSLGQIERTENPPQNENEAFTPQTHGVSETVQKVQNVLGEMLMRKKPKDDCSIFGKLVARKISHFDDHGKTLLLRKICDLITEFERNSNRREPTKRSPEKYAPSTPSSPQHQVFPVSQTSTDSTVHPVYSPSMTSPSQLSVLSMSSTSTPSKEHPTHAPLVTSPPQLLMSSTSAKSANNGGRTIKYKNAPWWSHSNYSLFCSCYIIIIHKSIQIWHNIQTYCKHKINYDFLDNDEDINIFK